MPRRAKPNGADDAESAALRSQVREGGKAAIGQLLQLASGAESEPVKLAAIKELLDRGFGRAASADPTGAVVAHVLIDDGYAS